MAKGHPAGLGGINAVAGLAATDRKRASQFMEYSAPVRYLSSLMHVGGQLRIWGQTFSE